MLHFFGRARIIYFDVEVSFYKMFVYIDGCLYMPFTDLLDFLLLLKFLLKGITSEFLGLALFKYIHMLLFYLQCTGVSVLS